MSADWAQWGLFPILLKCGPFRPRAEDTQSPARCLGRRLARKHAWWIPLAFTQTPSNFTSRSWVGGGTLQAEHPCAHTLHASAQVQLGWAGPHSLPARGPAGTVSPLSRPGLQQELRSLLRVTATGQTCRRRAGRGLQTRPWVWDTLLRPIDRVECVISKASGSPAHAFKFMEPSRSNDLT